MVLRGESAEERTAGADERAAGAGTLWRGAAGEEEKAQRVVAEELRRRRWKEASLGQRAKGDPEKVKIAMRLRKETLMTVAWIAERLQTKALSLNSPTFPFCPRVPVGAHSSFSNSGTEYLGFM